MKAFYNILTFFLLLNLFAGFTKTVFYYNLKGMLNQPSSDISESKTKGSFIKELIIKPSQFKIGKKIFRTEEIWLERTNVVLFSISIVPFIIDFPLYMNTDCYNICLYFHDRKKISPYFFIIEGNGSGFSTGGNGSYNETLCSYDWESLNVNLISSFRSLPKIKFKISK